MKFVDEEYDKNAKAAYFDQKYIEDAKQLKQHAKSIIHIKHCTCRPDVRMDLYSKTFDSDSIHVRWDHPTYQILCECTPINLVTKQITAQCVASDRFEENLAPDLRVDESKIVWPPSYLCEVAKRDEFSGQWYLTKYDLSEDGVVRLEQRLERVKRGRYLREKEVIPVVDILGWIGISDHSQYHLGRHVYELETRNLLWVHASKGMTGINSLQETKNDPIEQNDPSAENDDDDEHQPSPPASGFVSPVQDQTENAQLVIDSNQQFDQ
jgi:hypothetical protein